VRRVARRRGGNYGINNPDWRTAAQALTRTKLELTPETVEAEAPVQTRRNKGRRGKPRPVGGALTDLNSSAQHKPIV